MDRLSALTTPKPLLALGLAGAVGAMAIALISQYGFGWIPCALCVIQRYPYVLGIAAGAAAYALWSRPGGRRLAQGAAGLAGLSFAVGALIAAHHSGVEFGWWTAATTCTGPLDTTGSVEDIRRRLEGASFALCTVREPYLGPLTMTNLNLVASLGLAACFALAAWGGARPAKAAPRASTSGG